MEVSQMHWSAIEITLQSELVDYDENFEIIRLATDY